MKESQLKIASDDWNAYDICHETSCKENFLKHENKDKKIITISHILTTTVQPASTYRIICIASRLWSESCTKLWSQSEFVKSFLGWFHLSLKFFSDNYFTEVTSEHMIQSLMSDLKWPIMHTALNLSKNLKNLFSKLLFVHLFYCSHVWPKIKIMRFIIV